MLKHASYLCACGQVVCRVVPDWKEKWVMLCGPHWRFWKDERIRIEYPAAAIHLAESRASDSSPEPERTELDMAYFWTSRGPWEG
jgi:hypothetical protein